MSFETLAASNQDSAPREYCTIVYGTTTHRIAFGTQDMLIDGAIYTAIAAARGELVPSGVGQPTELMLTLPIDHALPRRYTAQGVPPKVITVTVWQQQKEALEARQLWTGNVTSMTVNEGMTEASFRIASRAAEAFQRRLPTVVAGRECPLIWAGARCGVDPDGVGATGLPNKITTTVLAVDGRDVRVDLAAITAGDPLRADWSKDGMLTHVASGETMTIGLQVDLSPGVSTVATLTMQSLIVGLKIGDTVVVFAGCPRDIVTCSAKFANKQRFGGLPQLPTSNPFTPQSWGLVKSL